MCKRVVLVGVYLLLAARLWASIEIVSMNSGPEAPTDNENQVVKSMSESAVMLSGVPTSSWTYGCSATSAGMIFGYYDRNGSPNMYTGPANSGVAPLTDLGNQCSIIATENGFDGRTADGHVDDYWVSYLSAGPDPWEENWDEHTWQGCTADFMGTSQWKWDFIGGDGNRDFNVDGATALFSNTSAEKLYDYIPPASAGLPQTALCHGLRLFAESRGYTVVENYTQKVDAVYAGGFSFDDYVAEIDAGRPVMLQVMGDNSGHSMVGVGYDAENTVYLHNTWGDYVSSMAWGGSYTDMELTAVTVIHLVPEPATIGFLSLGGLVLLKKRKV